MKRAVLITMILGIAALSVRAQISIDSSDLGNRGDKLYMFNDTTTESGLQITPGSASAQNWDYTDLVPHVLDSVEFRDPSGHPEGSSYQDADFLIPVMLGDGFTQKNDTVMQVLGLTGDAFDVGFPLTLRFDAPLPYIEFPSTLGSTFNRTAFTDTTFEDTFTGVGDSLRIEMTFQVNSECDAYGALETPADTYSQSLRQYAEFDILVEAYSIVIIFGMPVETLVFDTTQMIHAYNWYVKDGKYPVMQAIADQKDGEILSASFQSGSRPIPFLSVDHPPCYGDETGSITVENVYGGTPPYSYMWSTGAPGSQITGLSAGAYAVTVYDNDGDSAVTNIDIVQPDSMLVFATVTDESAPGENDGSIIIDSVTGGIQPYWYEWSNGKFSRNNEQVAAGAYTVVITDDNLCEQVFSFEVGVDSVASFTEEHYAEADLRVYPNPAGDYVRVEHPRGIERIEVYNLTGTLITAVNARKRERFELNTSEWGEGLYIVKVRSSDEVLLRKVKK